MGNKPLNLYFMGVGDYTYTYTYTSYKGTRPSITATGTFYQAINIDIKDSIDIKIIDNKTQKKGVDFGVYVDPSTPYTHHLVIYAININGIPTMSSSFMGYQGRSIGILTSSNIPGQIQYTDTNNKIQTIQTLTDRTPTVYIKDASLTSNILFSVPGKQLSLTPYLTNFAIIQVVGTGNDTRFDFINKNFQHKITASQF